MRDREEIAALFMLMTLLGTVIILIPPAIMTIVNFIKRKLWDHSESIKEKKSYIETFQKIGIFPEGNVVIHTVITKIYLGQTKKVKSEIAVFSIARHGGFGMRIDHMEKTKTISPLMNVKTEYKNHETSVREYEDLGAYDIKCFDDWSE